MPPFWMNILGGVAGRIVAQLEADLEDAAGLTGGADDGLSIGGIESERLFGVEVLAHLEDGDIEVLVGEVGDCDDDGVDILLIVEHLAEAGPLACGSAGIGDEFGGSIAAFFDEVTDGDHLDAPHAKHVPQQVGTTVSDADKGDADGIAWGLGAEDGRGGCQKGPAAPIGFRGTPPPDSDRPYRNTGWSGEERWFH